MAKFNDKEKFLTAGERNELTSIMRSKKESGDRVRRATILLDLDQGFSSSDISALLRIDLKTIYNLRARFEDERIDALNDRVRPPRKRRLNEEQLKELEEHLIANPPPTVAEVVARVKETYGVKYSTGGMTKLLKARGFGWRMPESRPRVADETAQREYIQSYECLKGSLEERQAILHMDAVHPQHQMNPAHSWFHKDGTPAVPCTTGRRRVNVIGALNVADGCLVSEEVKTVNGETVSSFFRKMHAELSDRYDKVHVVLDNARYHYAPEVKKLVEEDLGGWLELHYLPTYAAPHLNPIERLWGVMHKWITHNRCHASFQEFRERVLRFLNEDVPNRWSEIKSYVTDNFRVISHKDCTLYNWA